MRELTKSPKLGRMDQSTRWAEVAAQAIFHTLFASLYVEALSRSWRATDPRQRMALRLVALAYPLTLFPALVLLFPFRAGDDFLDGPALLVARRFSDVRALGLDLFHVWLFGLGAIGAFLFFMDVIPLLRASRRRERKPCAPGRGCAQAVEVVERLSRKLGIRSPSLEYLDVDQPILFCTGVRRHAIVVSRGALENLDEDELRAAIAHELAHLARHDPLSSWLLMAARALMFFNPAFQVVARALARDAEQAADEKASAAIGDRLALASGLLKLHRDSGSRIGGRLLPFAAALAEPLARVRSYDVEVRCRRLLDGPAAPLHLLPLRAALAAASLSAILFFVA